MVFAIPLAINSALVAFVASLVMLALVNILIALGKAKRWPRLIRSATAAIAVAGVSVAFWAMSNLPGIAYEIEQTTIEEFLFAAALWFIVYYWVWLLYFGLSRLARLTRPVPPESDGSKQVPYDRKWVLSLLRNYESSIAQRGSHDAGLP